MPAHRRMPASLTPRRAALLATAMAFLAGGCAAARGYAGPPRPRAEVAVIYGMPFLMTVRAVDGRPVSSALSGAIHVLPGAHVLSVEARWSNRCRQRLELAVNADAGQTYHLVMTERRPAPSEAAQLAEAAAGGAADAVTAYLFPVVLVALVIDPAPPRPPTHHELTVALHSDATGRPAGRWESHAGPTTRPRDSRMKTSVTSGRGAGLPPLSNY